MVDLITEVIGVSLCRVLHFNIMNWPTIDLVNFLGKHAQIKFLKAWLVME